MSGYHDDTAEEVRAEEAFVDFPRLRDAALKNLVENQHKAVTAPPGPLLILAGAGTGKTRCLTARIAWCIAEQKLCLQHVLAITFTRKAAKEMKERLASMMGPAANSMNVGTFHGICMRILRDNAEYAGLSPKFTVLDDDEQLRIFKDVINELFPNTSKQISAAVIRDALDAERNGDGAVDAWEVLSKNRKALETLQILETEPRLRAIATMYDQEKSDAQVLDYNDIIIKVIEMMERHAGVRDYYRKAFRLILCDEYQDTNAAQEKLISLLLNTDRNITCVGDEDQSVYGWRGADINNILSFEKRYEGATVIKLEQNFRSTGSILTAANKLIGCNDQRLGKNLYTVSESGATLTHQRYGNTQTEAHAIVNTIADLNRKGIDYRNIAVLGRYTTMIASIQLPLAQARIPFTVTAGKKAQETQDIQNVIAFFRFAKNRADDFALHRILTAKSRGLGPTKMKKVSDEARARRVPMIDALATLIEAEEIKGKVAVNLAVLIAFLEELSDDYQLQVPPAEIYQKAVAELEIDQDVEKAREKADKIAEKIQRTKAHAAIDRRTDRLAELQHAIASAPDLDEMIDALALDPIDGEEAKDGVWVGTIHAAKGLEFDHVILPCWSDGVFPSVRIARTLTSTQASPEEVLDARNQMEEERRLAYVALTRGKKTVQITSTEFFQGEPDLMPSRFIGEISRELAMVETLR